jgi:hypothetical protein
MSSLSEQERIGLEEVFLSISPSRNFLEKWSVWGKTIAPKKLASPLSLSQHSKNWLKNGLKNHKITKLFTKMQKRRKI